jgi:hypothetical protein
LNCWGPSQSWTQCLRSDGRQCAAPSRSTAGAGTQTYDHLGGIHPDSPCAARGNRLLHGRSSHVARAGDLRRAVLHSSREPPCGRRRHRCASRRALDRADRPQRDHGWMGYPPFSRSAIARAAAPGLEPANGSCLSEGPTLYDYSGHNLIEVRSCGKFNFATRRPTYRPSWMRQCAANPPLSRDTASRKRSS